MHVYAHYWHARTNDISNRTILIACEERPMAISFYWLLANTKEYGLLFASIGHYNYTIDLFLIAFFNRKKDGDTNKHKYK